MAVDNSPPFYEEDRRHQQNLPPSLTSPMPSPMIERSRSLATPPSPVAGDYTRGRLREVGFENRRRSRSMATDNSSRRNPDYTSRSLSPPELRYYRIIFIVFSNKSSFIRIIYQMKIILLFFSYIQLSRTEYQMVNNEYIYLNRLFSLFFFLWARILIVLRFSITFFIWSYVSRFENLTIDFNHFMVKSLQLLKYWNDWLTPNFTNKFVSY